MAADVGQRFSGCTYSDVPYNDHSTQDPSVQQMVQDHGSVSFGRFAAEPLSWERRSVFGHNSRQEELSKLTAPGLVAQKKAFFEEYYKKARQQKAQGAMHQTQATLEGADDESTLGRSNQEEQLPAVVSDDPVASAPSSSFEPSTEVSSSDGRNCQEAHGVGYLTFNPLFSQTAGLQNIRQEERSSSGETRYLDQEFPCAPSTSISHGCINEALERKVLAPRRVVSNDNDENNMAGTRIVLPIASVQSEGLKVVRERHGSKKSVACIDRLVKKSKDLPTSVIHIPRVDFRRNFENRLSQDLKDPFHKRVEIKLRALSDRMSAEKSAASSRSASYQPPDRAASTCRSSYQNADKLANSSRPSLLQNTGRVLAPSTNHRSSKGVRADTLPRESFFRKGSSVSHVASSNSTATEKSAAKIHVVPRSSQVGAKTYRSVQVASKRAAGPTRVNNAPQNKRKQLSTPAVSSENKPKKGYVRKTMAQSARSSSDNCPPAAKAPKFANRTKETKSEIVQKSRSAASHPTGGRNSMRKPTVNCNEQNRKVTSTRTGSLAGSSMRSNLSGGPSRTKNKPRQDRPRWR